MSDNSANNNDDDITKKATSISIRSLLPGRVLPQHLCDDKEYVLEQVQQDGNLIG